MPEASAGAEQNGKSGRFLPVGFRYRNKESRPSPDRSGYDGKWPDKAIVGCLASATGQQIKRAACSRNHRYSTPRAAPRGGVVVCGKRRQIRGLRHDLNLRTTFARQVHRHALDETAQDLRGFGSHWGVVKRVNSASDWPARAPPAAIARAKAVPRSRQQRKQPPSSAKHPVPQIAS